MKFTTATLSAAMLGFASFVQGITIQSPTAGTVLTAGSTVSVRIFAPLVQPGSVEASVVISLLSGAVKPTTSDVGTVLYDGKFNPTFHIQGSGPAGSQLYDTISVKIPANVTGTAQLNVVQPTVNEHAVVFTTDSVQVTVS
ncbi:unnamed protein product [Mycena citricolor]|uniref:Uncharacterized protein n=1 Tax=Mycena citricolor TaxID=2018698 RepID=A0AAD2K3F9_9AGAR|nr:unnamed protein product [Mycena citricolor]CAK5276537.1 unnamed protein product [Mycena citricolor]